MQLEHSAIIHKQNLNSVNKWIEAAWRQHTHVPVTPAKQINTYLFVFRHLQCWCKCIYHQHISQFLSIATTLLCLWYFQYFLPIIHFIASPPSLSAVFYHTYYHFWMGVSEVGSKKTEAEWEAVQPIQQISITWYAWSGQRYRVINWRVAAGQQCIALVRCPQRNKMQ